MFAAQNFHGSNSVNIMWNKFRVSWSVCDCKHIRGKLFTKNCSSKVWHYAVIISSGELTSYWIEYTLLFPKQRQCQCLHVWLLLCLIKNNYHLQVSNYWQIVYRRPLFNCVVKSLRFSVFKEIAHLIIAILSRSASSPGSRGLRTRLHLSKTLRESRDSWWKSRGGWQVKSTMACATWRASQCTRSPCLAMVRTFG